MCVCVFLKNQSKRSCEIQSLLHEHLVFIVFTLLKKRKKEKRKRKKEKGKKRKKKKEKKKKGREKNEKESITLYAF